jgi:gluconate kinase
VLIGDRPDVRLVYLRGEESLIQGRQAARHNHYMPASLVHSQFETLQEPGPDERPIIIDVQPPAHEVVRAIMDRLQ